MAHFARRQASAVCEASNVGHCVAPWNISSSKCTNHCSWNAAIEYCDAMACSGVGECVLHAKESEAAVAHAGNDALDWFNSEQREMLDMSARPSIAAVKTILMLDVRR